MRFSRLLIYTCLFLTLLNGACGQRRTFQAVYPVRGKVFFERKPAKGARVVFHLPGDPDPSAILPQAQVGDDGEFVLSTYNFEDGAPAGSYEVTVVHLQGGGPVNLLPERYQDPATSGLRVQIEKQSNELEPFNLTNQETALGQ